MKTQAILDKYRKIISGLLGLEGKDLKFYTVKQIYEHASMYPVMMRDAQEIAEIEYFQPEKNKDGEETGRQVRYTAWNHWSEGQYVLLYNKEVVASWELYKLPHCCAIIVSCKAYVAPKYRGKRLGTTLNNLRQDIGRLLGYSCMMCTDILTNEHQRKLLATNSWKDIHEVKNKRTGNTVFVSVINL